jgi:hypothetical protein
MPARALTILVVAMGVAILAGIAVIAATVAGRTFHSAPRTAASVTPAPPPAPFTAAPIDLPKGAHVAAISTGTDRLVINVALADGSQELIVIDLATGRRLGTVPLHTGR